MFDMYFLWGFFFCSTLSMRNEGGYEVIKKAIEKLQLKHKEHIAAYGEGNERRLTGRHETADINTFSWVRRWIPSSLVALVFEIVLFSTNSGRRNLKGKKDITLVNPNC
jgi:hypothetical protein